MLRDYINNRPREVVCFRHFYSLFHMAYNHQSTHMGGEFNVTVFKARLIFDKIFRLVHLPDIMVKGGYPHKKRVGMNSSRCFYGEISHYNTMMISSWSPKS